MVADSDVKREVREFYDRVGWQEASDGFYQNASYEDLRPVSHEYIHKCHLRVLRHLAPSGHLLLDAGSGPIQYPEYLEYSRSYRYRVCADISLVALREARKRLGDRGLYVVCDIARLPFKPHAFESLVSLHTIHHLPPEEHIRAYQELYRTLASSGKGVIVNGWDNPPLQRIMNICINFFNRLCALFRREAKGVTTAQPPSNPTAQSPARGTYVRKHDVSWLQKEIASRMPVSIWCWRSVSVSFLRTFIHQRSAGRLILRAIYALEELFPHFFGKNGQYPLIVLTKDQ
jgi:ubiquinone/menaquinone biosynthesis C-methylase UbiE